MPGQSGLAQVKEDHRETNLYVNAVHVLHITSNSERQRFSPSLDALTLVWRLVSIHPLLASHLQLRQVDARSWVVWFDYRIN
jgi:hypothetical protein